MSSILLNIVNQELCIRLTGTLLRFLWDGTVIGMCAFAMARFHRTATARMRYGIHAASLALMALCAAVTFACIHPADRRTGESVAPSDIKPISSTATTASDRWAFVSGVLTREPTQSQTKTADGSGFLAAGVGLQPQVKRVDATAVTKKSRLPDLVRLAAPYAACSYLLGLVAMLGRLCCALWGGHRLRQSAVALGDRDLLLQLRLQARRIGLTVIPTVASCERITIPVVAGILRPMILLPAGVGAELDAEQLLVILSHELAHIRRFDSLVNLLQRLLESILFFHPAVWYLSRQLSVERENCCDDAVVRAGNESTRYASALIRMAELCVWSRRPVSASELAALAANGSSDSQLTLRIRRLLDGEPRPRLTRTDALALALMVAMIAATIASVWHQAAAVRAAAFNAHATATFRLEGRVVNPGKPMTGAAVAIRRLDRDR
jgi:beta-lactamase regulating signal transducer with metallopeptidase domain